jgi:hypothetical protein
MRCSTLVHLLVTAVVAVAALPACGGDDDDSSGQVDASSVDGGAGASDARPPDAAPTGACEALCDCVVSLCEGDAASCIAECEGLAVAARSCRAEHCGYAQVDPDYHCPHARGEDMCD